MVSFNIYKKKDLRFFVPLANNQEFGNKLKEFMELKNKKTQKEKVKFEKLFNSMASAEEEEIIKKKEKERLDRKLARKMENQKSQTHKSEDLDSLSDLEDEDFEEKTYQPTFTLEDLQNGVILDAADMNCPLNQGNLEN